ncbi:hypothetical protein B0O80DRAFT_499626 [Mortierella sp. GBAus27b]|nr:hypothetical protein B0O80DRAFT_499626 [Mortierella sp. GBAus27b]
MGVGFQDEGQVVNVHGMENMKRHRPVVINPSSIGPSTWTSASETGSTGLELPSISELESSLPDKVFTSMTEHQEGLRRWWYVHEVLSEFYGSRKLKKWSWEQKKASRTGQSMAP